MFYLILKLHKDSILQVLGLQKRLSVNWAIEEAWKAQAPHEVFDVLLSEEISVKIGGEVLENALEFVHFILGALCLVQLSY